MTCANRQPSTSHRKSSNVQPTPTSWSFEPNVHEHTVFKLTGYKEAYDRADIVAFLVSHKEFKKLPYDEEKVILDFCGVFKRSGMKIANKSKSITSRFNQKKFCIEPVNTITALLFPSVACFLMLPGSDICRRHRTSANSFCRSSIISP